MLHPLNEQELLLYIGFAMGALVVLNSPGTHHAYACHFVWLPAVNVTATGGFAKVPGEIRLVGEGVGDMTKVQACSRTNVDAVQHRTADTSLANPSHRGCMMAASRWEAVGGCFESWATNMSPHLLLLCRLTSPLWLPLSTPGDQPPSQTPSSLSAHWPTTAAW
jgi:hypothetical protein